MRLRTSTPLLTLLGFMCITLAPAGPTSTHALSADHQLSPASTTYDDTLHLLKVCLHADSSDASDHAEAILLKEGCTRASDLLAACAGKDVETQFLAFFYLCFLNVGGVERCGKLLERRYGILYAGATGLSDLDLDRIDRWLTQKRTPNGYNCDVCKRVFPEPIDDALVYALMLNGSPRSKTILKGIREFAASCVRAGLGLAAIEGADSLIAPAGEIGHDLRIEPDIGEAVRASAFFLPEESREPSKNMVQVLSRSNNRILLKITYRAGFMGGGIYYVALAKDGSVWQYAFITKRMAF